MSSIFGNTAPAAGTSLFGNNAATAATSAPSGTSLFGNSTANPPAGNSLFGNTQQSGNTGSSLFGGGAGGAGTQQQQSGGLFGGSTQQTGNASANTGSSLFGGGSNTTQQQAAPTNTTSSLFSNLGAATQPTQSLFGGASNTTQQQQPQQSFQGFNPLTAPFPPNLTLGQQQDLARTRLQQSGLAAVPNTKTPIDQATTLIKRWDPQSQDTLLQAYLYNAVSAAYAPYYGRNPDDDEEAWGRALAEASRLNNNNGSGTGAGTGDSGDVPHKFVPVLVRGFHALGLRVETQTSSLRALRVRLHEMMNSLQALQNLHTTRITPQIEAARRQHAALAQRTLRLAVKVQTLRMRGYALDSAEEALRKALQKLEQGVQAPEISGREDEIWARMVGVRERGRWLEAEGRRIGRTVGDGGEGAAGSGAAGGGSGLSEDVLQKTRAILRDYDGQLGHLARELEAVRGEYAEWEDGQRVRRR